MSSLDKIDIKYLKRNDVPGLNFDRLNEYQKNESKNTNSKKSKSSSYLDQEYDRKIEEALDAEIKQDPAIVDKFENIQDLKQ